MDWLGAACCSGDGCWELLVGVVAELCLMVPLHAACGAQWVAEIEGSAGAKFGCFFCV